MALSSFRQHRFTPAICIGVGFFYIAFSTSELIEGHTPHLTPSGAVLMAGTSSVTQVDFAPAITYSADMLGDELIEMPAPPGISSTQLFGRIAKQVEV